MDSLILRGESRLMVLVTSMSPIQTIIAFRSFHRPAHSLQAAERAEPATESFPDHRTWAQTLPATTMSLIPATIVYKSSALVALRRLQMQAPIKQLNVAVRRRQ